MEEFEPLNTKETSIKLRLKWETQWVYLSLCDNWLIVVSQITWPEGLKIGVLFPSYELLK